MTKAIHSQMIITTRDFGQSARDTSKPVDIALVILEDVGREIERINLLEPALVNHHVLEETVTLWAKVLRAFEQLKRSALTRSNGLNQLERFYQDGLEGSAKAQRLALELLPFQSIVESDIAELFYCIGAHNNSMQTKPYTDMGIAKMQTEQSRAMATYEKNYGNALGILRHILVAFYSSQANHPYPAIKVVDWVETQCIKNQIKFPKDRKAEQFTSFVQTFLPDAVRDRKGATPQAFRKLPEEKMVEFYPLFANQ